MNSHRFEVALGAGSERREMRTGESPGFGAQIAVSEISVEPRLYSGRGGLAEDNGELGRRVALGLSAAGSARSCC